tara:strand:- start:455 stop:1309 length:855 start_codon:yes stop_codon:yes gene_type:complete
MDYRRTRGRFDLWRGVPVNGPARSNTFGWMYLGEYVDLPGVYKVGITNRVSGRDRELRLKGVHIFWLWSLPFPLFYESRVKTVLAKFKVSDGNKLPFPSESFRINLEALFAVIRVCILAVSSDRGLLLRSENTFSSLIPCDRVVYEGRVLDGAGATVLDVSLLRVYCGGVMPLRMYRRVRVSGSREFLFGVGDGVYVRGDGRPAWRPAEVVGFRRDRYVVRLLETRLSNGKLLPTARADAADADLVVARADAVPMSYVFPIKYIEYVKPSRTLPGFPSIQTLRF